jgi:hypothetical protein
MPGNALARDPSMQPGPTLARAGMAPRNALADGGMLNPALQLVSDDSAAQPPAPPSAAAPGANDMVDTPLGRMPRALAQRRAMGLALAGKGDAGKMLSDSVTTAGIGTTTRNQIEEKTMNSAMALGRLDDIDKGFDPKYLEIPNRMKMLGASWSAKFGGKLSPDVQNDLGKYAAFRARAVGNLSLNLKELSGAQVTPQEYERIQAAMPAAGTGVFDGDDPVSFKAKLDENRNLQRSAIARYNFMRSKGLNFDKDSIDKFLSLDDVPAAIDQRAAEIEDQIKQKNPKVDPMDLQTQTDRQIKQEFGI